MSKKIKELKKQLELLKEIKKTKEEIVIFDLRQQLALEEERNLKIKHQLEENIITEKMDVLFKILKS